MGIVVVFVVLGVVLGVGLEIASTITGVSEK